MLLRANVYYTELLTTNGFCDSFQLDFWDGPHRGAALDLHVTPKNERIIRMILEARGMAWNVSVANLQE